jgi:formylglycine-generating enzyme required for sulfatase activity
MAPVLAAGGLVVAIVVAIVIVTRKGEPEAAMQPPSVNNKSAEPKPGASNFWDGRESIADYARRLKLESTREIDLGGGVKLELVLIPAGSFTMGSPSSEAGRPKGSSVDETQHYVTITKPFYMGKHDVTQVQWERVMGSNPSQFKGANNPVDTVSWDDARAFLARAGNGLRLPTEAQWEWACRAGTKTRFYTGDSESDLVRAGWYGSYTTTQGLLDATTKPVGQKQPNAFGLYDMHGNVMQWCEDWYGEKYYESGPIMDPPGPQAGEFRVMRGGTYNVAPEYCRAAHRSGNSPDRRLSAFGFRVVMTLQPQTNVPAPALPPPAPPPPQKSDPVASFKAFTNNFMKAIGEAPPHHIDGSDVGGYHYPAVDNKYRASDPAIDVSATNSLTSPYKGTLQITLQTLKSNGQADGLPSEFLFKFNYSDGRWEPSFIGYKSAIMDSFKDSSEVNPEMSKFFLLVSRRVSQ